MESHHPAKFGDHRRCGSGDIMFLVAEEQNSNAVTLIAITVQSAITVYFQRTRVENKRHIILLTLILVTRTQSSNWTKL